MEMVKVTELRKTPMFSPGLNAVSKDMKAIKFHFNSILHFFTGMLAKG